MKKIGFAISFLFFVVYASAQTDHLRCKWVSVSGKQVLLDSLTIVPGSVQVNDSAAIRINYDVSTGLAMITAPRNTDSVYICYRVFPYDFHQEIRNRSLQIYDSNAFFPVSTSGNQELLRNTKDELFHTDNIYKSGMISRGVSFGNRQDIFVNSVLNLQLEGRLSENLNIRASVTDQNIPYQPEGNTKLVQDFDNVLFELYNDDFSISGGDLLIAARPSEFLRFNRNVQGAMVRSSYRINDSMEGTGQVAVSVSKGKFFSEKLEVIDGVMGPYKIYGPERSSFIIIVAGSEKVYLDGSLLERGYNNDYVIDYNTAEITFTSRILITKYSRVNIDFEYTNQAYSRMVLNASQTQKFKRAEVSVQYYQEKDNRQRPLTFDLNDPERSYLSGISGEAGNAVLPGWDSVDYNENRVLYKSIDMLGPDGLNHRVFIFSQDPDSAVYQVVFTGAGPGRGDYERKNELVNGKVYEWVGEGNGSFLPVKVIPLPETEQMLSIRTTVEIGKSGSVYSELALSRQDQNLFNENSGVLNGFALKTGVNSGERPVGFIPGYKIKGGGSIEYDNSDFRSIDRFRPIEYDRDWNYNPVNDTLSVDDRIITLFGTVGRDAGNFLNARLTGRQKPGLIDGWQGNLDSNFDFSLINVSGDLFLMRNENGRTSSDWIRYHLDTYLKTGIMDPGYQYTRDRNAIRPAASDSIISTEMDFREHMFYVKNSDSLKTKINLTYKLRTDRIPVEGMMQDFDESRTASALLGTAPGKSGEFDFTMTYRELSFLADSLDQAERSLLGRVDWSINLLKDHIRSDLTYAAGNGRELKREYVFIEVPVGQGTHTWRDDNLDGRRDLNEFYIAINPDEKNYIKLFTPTDEYVLAYENNLNYRLFATMPLEWEHETGLKRILGNFSNAFNIDLNQKIANDNFWDNIFFRGRSTDKQDLITYHENLRNSLYYNRADPQYGFEMILNRLNYKQLLANGYESRDKMIFRLVSRLNVLKQYNIILGIGKSDINSGSDFLPGRDFRIEGKELNSTFEWQPSNFLRIGTEYAFSDNKNGQNGETGSEYSLSHELGLKLKWSKASDKNIDMSVRYIKINFSGEENTPAGYELLKGLQPGNNLTWSLNWQQKLFSGMQMNISYEGRKSGSMDVIHIGRMQVMALF